MRFVVVGAGAVGGVIAGRLFEAGNDVAVVARGRHLEVVRSEGLTVVSPAGSVTLSVPAYSHPAEAGLGQGDVAIIATKSQDTIGALDALVACGCDGLIIACAQNGVSNEQTALRRFADVYGICVVAPTAHTEPGVVEAYSSPVSGILDVGRYPSGTDYVSDLISNAFQASTFESLPRVDIMRWKYRKLLMNLSNVLDALLGSTPWPEAITRAMQAEAEAALAAAGIDPVSAAEEEARRGDLLRVGPVAGSEDPSGRVRRRGGGSSWQSLKRGLGTIETDYLNGEIVLLGRLHGVPTPVNATLQRVAAEAARNRITPGSFSADDLLALLG